MGTLSPQAEASSPGTVTVGAKQAQPSFLLSAFTIHRGKGWEPDRWDAREDKEGKPG